MKTLRALDLSAATKRDLLHIIREATSHMEFGDRVLCAAGRLLHKVPLDPPSILYLINRIEVVYEPAAPGSRTINITVSVGYTMGLATFSTSMTINRIWQLVQSDLQMALESNNFEAIAIQIL